MMRRVLLFLVVAQFSVILESQIIADHTVVDLYDDIPQQWINIVKTKWLSVTGASHATAIHVGFQNVQALDANYAAIVQYSGEPNPYQTYALRSSGATYGSFASATGWNHILSQEDWWTNPTANARIKAYLQYCHDNGPELFATMYGWSFDANFDHEFGNGPYGDYDPVYHVRYAGSTHEGIDGNRPWGLDAGDSDLVGNRVTMSTYISSVNQYIQYCKDHNISTAIIYSTGPVDDNDIQGWNINERGYQQYLKWQFIRDYINTQEEAYFFDWADILSYNDAGVQATTSWTDNNSTLKTFPLIHPDNMGGDYVGHIGSVGAVRLAKAMWWMLARIAGWDGIIGGMDDTSPPSVPSGLTLDMASQSSVTLSWNASSDNVGVSGYRLYRDGKFLDAIPGLNYTDNTVSSCSDYSYSVSAYDAAENESAQSAPLLVNNCAPDLTSTITLSPNVAHGVTIHDLIVRITELNSVNTDGPVIIHIPKDQLWDISGSYDPSMTILGTTSLSNNHWAYSEDEVNHIFISSATIPAGGYSSFGFRISFNPGNSRGTNPITSQVVSGGGGEVQVNNNSDSEQLDYFQD